MNHGRNAIRFGIAVFWILVAGLLFTFINNIHNNLALGWSSWMLYGTIAVVVVYAGSVLTKKLWSLK